jgi:transposase
MLPRCTCLLEMEKKMVVWQDPPHASDTRSLQTLTPLSPTCLICGRAGRPLAFDKATYARRNIVERCNNRLKQWRGLATRYERRAVNYRAMLVLASIVLWLEP